MKCPKCNYDYDRPPMVSVERCALIDAHIEKYDMCIACAYENMPKAGKLSFGQYIRDVETELEAE